MHGLIKAEHQLLMSMVRFTVVLVLLLISVRFSLIHLQTPGSKSPPLLEGCKRLESHGSTNESHIEKLDFERNAIQISTSMAYEAVLDRVQAEIVTAICGNLII